MTGLTISMQNPHNNPGNTQSHRQFGTFAFGAIPAQAYAEYSVSSAFIVQTGLGYVPFGHALQQREPFLFIRRGGPQLAGSVGIASPLWMGVHIQGVFSRDESHLGYNLYTFTPPANTKTLGGGGRLWWSPNEKMTFGLSSQTGKLTNDAYTSHGADVVFQSGSSGVKLEYGRSQLASGASAPVSYYIEPFYGFGGAWVVYGVADYLDNPTNVMTAASVPDPYQKWVLGGGVNWLPVSNARFRLGLLSHDYVGDTATINGQSRKYYNLDLSCGVAF
jgi:hypothetical protein